MKLFLEYSGGPVLEDALGSCACRTSRRGNRIRAALVSCQGADMGAQAITAASCSLAWGLLAGGAPLQGTARTLLENMGQREYGFTLLELDGRGHLRAVEYGMPAIALLRRGGCHTPWGGEAPLAGRTVLLREDMIRDGDLCCAFSQGIGRCGGWQRAGALDYLCRAVTGRESARQIKERLFAACRGLAGEERAEGAAFFCRAKALSPLLVAVGVPQSRAAQAGWARTIAAFRGSRVVVGRPACRLLRRLAAPDGKALPFPAQLWPDDTLLPRVLPLLGGAGAATAGRTAQQLAALLDSQSTSVRLLVGVGRSGPGLSPTALLAEQIADRLRQGDKRADVDYC